MMARLSACIKTTRQKEPVSSSSQHRQRRRRRQPAAYQHRRKKLEATVAECSHPASLHGEANSAEQAKSEWNKRRKTNNGGEEHGHSNYPVRRSLTSPAKREGRFFHWQWNVLALHPPPPTWSFAWLPSTRPPPPAPPPPPPPRRRCSSSSHRLLCQYLADLHVINLIFVYIRFECIICALSSSQRDI